MGQQIGLQRSKQLREHYETLSTSESKPQFKRPSAALSPEDLTDTEWYYLVCMSLIFDFGYGLPGRTLSTNQSMWICNAPFADSKVFTRSLLAKSALVQLEIITEVNNLQLETHSVLSSTIHDVLSLTIVSNFTGSTAESAAKIRKALERFASHRSQ